MTYKKYFFSFTKGFAAGMAVSLLFILLFSPFGEERTETIFVYGTLTNPLIRSYACWCLVGSTQSTLTNYRKEGLTVIPELNSHVNGKLITVSPSELTRIDRYENVPKNYQRTMLTVASTTAWIYIKN